MDWIVSLFTESSIAHDVVVYSLVIALGVLLGKIKFFGISLGVTFVLFVGIVMSHFGFSIANATLLNFIRDFGLILFVFSIGMQVGPGFFSSFKKGGVQMNMLAVMVVLLGIAIARRISQPLAKLQGLMEQAGKGNLTLRGEVTSADEIGQVTGAFNKMIQSQHDVVGMVQKAAMELAAASEEMAASSEQVT